MKKFAALLTLAGMLLVASCSKEGSEPAAPSDDRDKFLGSWLCAETISGQTTTFTIDIAKTGSDSVRIKNFSNYGDFTIAYGEVSGNGLTIPQQSMGVTSIPVQGSGIYSSTGGGKITLNYVVDGNTASAVCTRP